jgi:hypothetical protein
MKNTKQSLADSLSLTVTLRQLQVALVAWQLLDAACEGCDHLSEEDREENDERGPPYRTEDETFAAFSERAAYAIFSTLMDGGAPLIERDGN